MKLGICCNHSYPHCGGSERIIQQIAESMSNKYHHKVDILSFSIKKTLYNNNVKLIPCLKDSNKF